VSRRSALWFPLLAAILVATSAAPAAAMALGVSIPGGRSAQQVQQALDDFTTRVGQQPALWSLWSEWGSRGGHAACQSDAGTCSFPTAAVEALHAEGVTPVIWWAPTNPNGDAWVKGKYERYARILDGRHDAYIRDWAIAAREAGQASGRVVLIRFAQEANGHFFPWSIDNFDNTVANYKAAWRYVWRIFKQVGARPYAKFLWSVNKQDCNNCNPFSKVYPGRKYVDYAGLTAFNWGRWQGRRWKSMVSVLEGQVRDMMRVTGKPIIVAELASHFKGGDKAAWIRRGYKKVRERWPRIKAIAYLDTDQPHLQSGHPDWRLVKPNDGSALEAYSDIAGMSVFQSQLP
jgi:hypothetical protein